MTDEFGTAVRRLTAEMPPAVARVAAYLDRNRVAVLASSAAQIAAQAKTSDATVIRTVQALGYDGLPALKQALAATLDGQASPATNMGRTLAEVGGDVERAVNDVLEVHREALEGLASPEGRAGVRAAIAALHPAKRIGIFGIGPSAHLARYVSFQLTRLGRRSFVLDAAGWGLADQLLGLESGDAVILLAYGQPYREVLAVMKEARRRLAVVVLVTDAATSALAREASVVLLARRGRADRVALHAATLVALEALMLGMAAIDGIQTVAQLAELGRLRKLVGP